MNYQLLLAFTIGMLVLAASPGPGVVASISRAISHGFKSSLFVIAGLAIGDVIFLSLALLGMSTISKLMGDFFFLIKIAGGLYLIYLGIKSFFSAASELHTSGSSTGGDAYKTFLSGFLVTMGNPKPILFYASVVPTIINIKDVHITEALMMMAIIVAVSFLVLGTYCYLASLSGKLIGGKSAQKYFNYISGVLMAGVGVYILFLR